jgi:hypothetical protein
MDKSSVARFYFAGMTAYLLTVAAIATGWRAGRGRRNAGTRLWPLTAAMLVGLGVLWLVAAQIARRHADREGFGSDCAGWFAHSGKWFTLLAAMMFGHGWIGGTGQFLTGKARRSAYFVAVLGVAALVVSRTVPV